MRTIETHKEYKAVCLRIEELLKTVGNETLPDDPNFIELDLLSDLIADYEELNEPLTQPALVDVIKLRMYEKRFKSKTAV